MSITVTHTYTGPKATAERTGKCPTCGKRTRRTRTFERTVSPFNLREDGAQKTWEEVRADVRADADAWDPKPEIFEHDACAAERLAPPVAEPEPMSLERRSASVSLAQATIQAADWALVRGLPLPSLEIEKAWSNDGAHHRASVLWIRAGEIPLWARALRMETVGIDGRDGVYYARLTGVEAEVRWYVHGQIEPHATALPLGGADVEWFRDQRTNRKTGRGRVSVDELAAGLARLGIAEILPGPAA